MVPAQRGVEPLEVGVSAGDDGRSLVAAASLDYVDGVELRGHQWSLGRDFNADRSSLASPSLFV